MPVGLGMALFFLALWSAWCVMEAVWNSVVDQDYKLFPRHLWYSMTHLSKTWKSKK